MNTFHRRYIFVDFANLKGVKFRKLDKVCDKVFIFLSREEENIPADLTINCDEEIPLPPLVSASDNCPAISIDKKEKNNLAIVSKEKAEIIQTFNNEVDKKTVELIKNPNLISRYIFELQKRKSIEIGDQEQLLKMAQAMQGLNEKNLEIKETALITKEEKIAHIIQIQGYELKKNNDALSGYFEKLAIEKQKWNLQKERDLLNSDKKLFEIGKQGSYNELSSQQIQLFQQEVNLQLDNKEFDIHQREKFVGLMQHELQIDKKHALNQFTEQAFDLKKRESE